MTYEVIVCFRLDYSDKRKYLLTGIFPYYQNNYLGIDSSLVLSFPLEALVDLLEEDQDLVQHQLLQEHLKQDLLISLFLSF